MLNLLMAGRACCFESWMVDVPWGTGRKSLAEMVLSTFLVSRVCFEQIVRLRIWAGLSIPFSRSEHPGSDGKLEVR